MRRQYDAGGPHPPCSISLPRRKVKKQNAPTQRTLTKRNNTKLYWCIIPSTHAPFKAFYKALVPFQGNLLGPLCATTVSWQPPSTSHLRNCSCLLFSPSTAKANKVRQIISIIYAAFIKWSIKRQLFLQARCVFRKIIVTVWFYTGMLSQTVLRFLPRALRCRETYMLKYAKYVTG